MSHPADGIRVKIERAREHIRQLDAEASKFLRETPYRLSVQPGRDTERVVWATMDAAPPLRLGTIAGDAVHNLRAALDLTVYQLVLANRQSPTDKTAFPASKSREAFEKALGGPQVKGLCSEAMRLVSELKSYKGGNAVLWHLHQLDIMDKHHVLIPSVVYITDGEFERRRIVGEIHTQLETIRQVRQPLTGQPLTRFHQMPDDVEVPMTADLKLDVAFSEPTPVEGEPMVPTLVGFADYLEGALEPFISLL